MLINNNYIIKGVRSNKNIYFILKFNLTVKKARKTLFKTIAIGAPGWFSQLSVRLRLRS